LSEVLHDVTRLEKERKEGKIGEKEREGEGKAKGEKLRRKVGLWDKWRKG